MGNVVDYVCETKDQSFAEEPFSVEDALVLSEFCYLKFDDFVSSDCNESVAFSDICKSRKKERLFAVKSKEKDNKKLFYALKDSNRFKDMRIGYYVNHIDPEEETQFAAMTFYLPEDIVYVSFRGTDETMAGWQEDFCLAMKKPILGQTLSAKYLNTLASTIKKPFYVGGHSKGGNLAMYASICANKTTQKRIIKIFSFDGPGFRPEFLEKTDYEAVKAKLVRVMPKSSPVGLLLNSPGEYEVIEAKSIGALQHDIYNWVIKDGRLVQTTMSEGHINSVTRVNEWILSLDDESLMSVVEFLCWVLDSTEADTTEEFKENAFEHTKALLKAGKEADDEMKDMVGEFIKSYIEFTGESFMEDITEKYDEIMSGIYLKYDELTQEIKSFTEEAKELIDKAISETKEKIEDSIEKIGDTIEGSIDAIGETIEETKGKIDKSRDKKKRK